MESHGNVPDEVKAAPQATASYVVCATQRSGSTMLCEGLRNTGIAGVPREYFIHWTRAEKDDLPPLKRELTKPWLISPPEYLQKVRLRGTTPNGVLGIKIMWGYFATAIRHMQTIPSLTGLPGHEILARVFPSPRYVFMTRADKVRQAISMAKARQSGMGSWLSLDPAVLDNIPLWRNDFPDLSIEALEKLRDELRVAVAAAIQRPLVYDFDQIASGRAQLVAHEQAWEGFFETAGIHPHRVVYEQFAASYEETLRNILAYLGLTAETPPIRPRAVMRQSDAVNEEWAERYAADLRARGGPPAEHRGTAMQAS